MDEGVGDAAFLDALVGNPVATRDPQTAANGEPVETAESAG